MNFKTFFVCLLILLLNGFLQNSWGQVLNNETLITIDGKGRKKTKRTVLIQVNEKNENFLAHVEIRHNPLQDFSFGHAKIFDSKGNVLRKIKKRDLSTRSDLSYAVFYQDDLITEFDLYWHQYPYLIEYSYTIEEKEFIYVSWWTPILYPTIPTIRASLEVHVPLNYEVQINQSEDILFNESSIEGSKWYQWKSTFQGNIKNEIFSPPVQESIPMVGIVPLDIRYGVNGSSESWSSFGTWLTDLNKGTDQLPLGEKKVIEKLIEGTTDKREIIKKLYHYLQDHTRYINVAIDVGGLKSYPADYVCNNKYGDCKALTTYMKSMLSSIGIPSLYTVINSGENGARVNLDFPGQQFNHVILAVPLEKDTVWLENTSGSLPFNYLGTFTQNRYALAVDGEKSKLIRTPKLKPAEVLTERDYEFWIDENNEWQGEVTLNLRGSAFEEVRQLLLNGDDKKLQLVLNNNIDIKGFRSRDWKTVNFNRDSTYVELHITGDLPDPIREVGGWKVINPVKVSIPEFEEPGTRTLDVRINYPINSADKIVYNLQNLENKEVHLPENFILQSNYGYYESIFTREDNTIFAREKFTLLSNDIPIGEYPEFYSFIESITNHKKKTAILIR